MCRDAIVHEISGIARCFVGKAANENAAADVRPSPPHVEKLEPTPCFPPQRVAVTEGVNLRACWNFGNGVVDLNKIYTNDVGAILRTYGVEAARTSIIKEMSGVFSVYGIGVDYRHLTIIADYMVRTFSPSFATFRSSLDASDMRGRVQAVQPHRPLEQHLALPQGVVRDNRGLCRRGGAVRRL